MEPEEVRARLKGPFVPLPTFYKEDLSLDLPALAEYVEFLCDAGIPVVSPLGTTGEFYLLTPEEHRAVVKTVVEAASGDTITLVGASHTSTATAVELAKFAKEAGADAALVTSPYYYNDGSESIEYHYKTVADEAKIPLVVYHNWTAFIEVDIFDRLADHPYIVGIKEASGKFAPLLNEIMVVGDRLAVIGGGSMRWHLAGYALGSPGYFVSIGNFVPHVSLEFVAALEANDWAKARRLAFKVETPWIDCAIKNHFYPSLKASIAMFGYGSEYMRPPLKRITDEGREELRKVLTDVGLLK